MRTKPSIGLCLRLNSWMRYRSFVAGVQRFRRLRCGRWHIVLWPIVRTFIGRTPFRHLGRNGTVRRPCSQRVVAPLQGRRAVKRAIDLNGAVARTSQTPSTLDWTRCLRRSRARIDARNRRWQPDCRRNLRPHKRWSNANSYHYANENQENSYSKATKYVLKI